MGKLIDETDLMNLLYALDDARYDLSYAIKKIPELPTVEAIPITEMRKMLRDCADKVSDNVLDIVREDYIHKADYEARLKADLVAMLTEILTDFDNQIEPNSTRIDCEAIIEQKIQALEGKTDGGK